MAAAHTPHPPRRTTLRACLWTAQALVATFLLYGAYMKLGLPGDERVAMIPWTAQHPILTVFTGLVDLLGGLGLVLPALTRILPHWTVRAAWGVVVLQVLAFGFHGMRGEWAVTPFNLVLLTLAVFIAWGRGRAAPVAPREPELPPLVLK